MRTWLFGLLHYNFKVIVREIFFGEIQSVQICIYINILKWAELNFWFKVFFLCLMIGNDAKLHNQIVGHFW